MADSLRLTEVRLSRARWADEQRGLLGWVKLVVNGQLQLDGLTLRRTADGRYILSFPERRDAQGRPHPVVAPITDEARVEIERQVLTELGLAEPTR